MKKLWIIACLLLLVGCTDLNQQGEKSNNEPHELQEEISKVEEIQITPNPKENQQLANVLIQLYKTYGVISSNHEYHDRKGDLVVGLVFADLIDFNKDGQKELYVLFKSGYLMKDGFSHRTNNGYIEEVWGIGVDEPILLWNQHYTFDSNESSDLSVSMILLSDGTAVLKHSTKQAKFSNTNLYSLQDHKFSLADEFSIQKEKKNEYKVNGVSVDIQGYTERLDKYDGIEKFIIRSDAGKKEFGFSLSDPSAQIILVMDVLSVSNNHTLLEDDEISKPDEIISSIKDYRNFGNIDVRDPSTYTTMIDSLILNGVVVSDAEQYDYFGIGFKEETIIDAVKTYFDVDLIPSSLGLPSELTGYHWLHYVNNGFYLPASDYYPQEVITAPEKIVQLSDNLYYAKVNNFNFNTMDHSFNTEIQFKITEFYDVPINEWPEHTHPYLTKALPTYLILKKVDNQYQLLYKMYHKFIR